MAHDDPSLDETLPSRKETRAGPAVLLVGNAEEREGNAEYRLPDRLEDDPALGVGKSIIRIEFDGAVERSQGRLVLAGQSRERKAGKP